MPLSGGFFFSFSRDSAKQTCLKVLFDSSHPGEEEHFHFNMKTLMRRGHSFLDVIAPPFLSYKPDYIRIGKRYGRVLYLRDYPTILKDSMIAEMCNLGRNLMLSIDLISIPTSEAVKEVNNILLGIATNAAKWTQKQNQNLNWSATLPYDIQQQQQTTEELLQKLTQDNQQLKFVTVTLIHLADSKKQLDGDTATLISTGRKYSCEFEVLKYRTNTSFVRESYHTMLCNVNINVDKYIDTNRATGITNQ